MNILFIIMRRHIFSQMSFIHSFKTKKKTHVHQLIQISVFKNLKYKSNKLILNHLLFSFFLSRRFNIVARKFHFGASILHHTMFFFLYFFFLIKCGHILVINIIHRNALLYVIGVYWRTDDCRFLYVHIYMPTVFGAHWEHIPVFIEV